MLSVWPNGLASVTKTISSSGTSTSVTNCQPRVAPSAVRRRMPNPLDYLHLNGTFDRLTPLDDYTRNEVAGDTSTTVTPAEDAQLVNTTQKLGLTLPLAFLRFISDGAKHEYFASQISSMTANFFMLSWVGKLEWDVHLDHHDREESNTNNIPNAYLFTFYSDHQGCDCWNLYLDTCGRHGVPSADSDIPEASRTDDDENLKHTDARDLTNVEQELGTYPLRASEVTEMRLHRTDFEEWLVHLNTGTEHRSWRINVGRLRTAATQMQPKPVRG